MLAREQEIKDLIHQSRIGSRFRLLLVGGGILVFPLIAYALNFRSDIILRFAFIFIGYLIIIGIFNFFIRKQKKERRIYELNFVHIILDFSFIVFLMHYGGGISWIIPFAYMGALAFAYIVLPRTESFLLTLFLLLIVNGLVVLEYFGFLNHHSVFVTFDIYNNFKYVIATLSAFFGLIISTAITLNFFAGSIREKNNLLKERVKEAQEIKDGLEIRVRARKRELEELTKKLDSEAQKKSKELKEKFKELQEINQQTVKRELRMLELKKEIKELKKIKT